MLSALLRARQNWIFEEKNQGDVLVPTIPWRFFRTAPPHTARDVTLLFPSLSRTLPHTIFLFHSVTDPILTGRFRWGRGPVCAGRNNKEDFSRKEEKRLLNEKNRMEWDWFKNKTLLTSETQLRWIFWWPQDASLSAEKLHENYTSFTVGCITKDTLVNKFINIIFSEWGILWKI